MLSVPCFLSGCFCHIKEAKKGRSDKSLHKMQTSSHNTSLIIVTTVLSLGQAFFGFITKSVIGFFFYRAKSESSVPASFSDWYRYINRKKLDQCSIEIKFSHTTADIPLQVRQLPFIVLYMSADRLTRALDQYVAVYILYCLIARAGIKRAIQANVKPKGYTPPLVMRIKPYLSITSTRR